MPRSSRKRVFRVTLTEYVESVYEISAMTTTEAKQWAINASIGLDGLEIPLSRRARYGHLERPRLASREVHELIDELRPQGPPDQCWPWRGTITGNGYGQLSLNGRSVVAHRLIFQREVGPIPPDLVVCHRCDNPPCCNPAHLFLGSNADNQRDKTAKGRQAKGEANGGGGRLTEADVREIRLLAGPESERRKRRQPRPMTYAAIGQRFGVSGPMVGAIARREAWGHVV